MGEMVKNSLNHGDFGHIKLELQINFEYLAVPIYVRASGEIEAGMGWRGRARKRPRWLDNQKSEWTDVKFEMEFGAGLEYGMLSAGVDFSVITHSEGENPKIAVSNSIYAVQSKIQQHAGANSKFGKQYGQELLKAEAAIKRNVGVDDIAAACTQIKLANAEDIGLNPEGSHADILMQVKGRVR